MWREGQGVVSCSFVSLCLRDSRTARCYVQQLRQAWDCTCSSSKAAAWIWSFNHNYPWWSFDNILMPLPLPIVLPRSHLTGALRALLVLHLFNHLNWGLLLLSWLLLILHGVHICITLLPGRWKMLKCLRQIWHRWHAKTLYVAETQSSTWWRSIWTKPWYQGHLQPGWFSLVAFTLDP